MPNILRVRGGDNPLISIRRVSDMPVLTLATGARTARAPREPHSTHVVPALKQTGSAFKDKEETWIHWTPRRALRFAVFINLSVSLRLGLRAWGRERLIHQSFVFLSCYHFWIYSKWLLRESFHVFETGVLYTYIFLKITEEEATQWHLLRSYLGPQLSSREFPNPILDKWQLTLSCFL